MKALPSESRVFTIGKQIHKTLCEEEFASINHSKEDKKSNEQPFIVSSKECAEKKKVNC